jgi:hypothetical protein
LNMLVIEQLFACAFADDAAAFENIGALGQG